MDLFTNIQIQTTTLCNRQCEFCPNSSRPLPKGWMPRRLFEKIVDNLGQLGFSGRVSPDLNAEPILDKRLPDFIDLIRNTCPSSYIMINSNGDFLNEENLIALFEAGLNCLTINCYDDGSQFKSRIDFINQLALRHSIFEVEVDIPIDEEYSLHPVDYQFVVVRNCVHYSIDSRFLTSRAGNVKDKKVHNLLPLNRSCSRPFNQMYINYLGEAVLCSEDWYSEAIMGYLDEFSLEEIWNGTKYEHYRTFLRQCDRSLPVCRLCDL